MFDVLVNDSERCESVLAAAQEVVGPEKVTTRGEAVMGSEDMADMLAVIPGAYFTVGHGGGVPLHNPGFVMDDAMLPIGASIFARLVETRGNQAAT